MRLCRRVGQISAIVLIFGVSLLAPGKVRAHAFGARYDLPLPLDFYLAAAGLVVLLTFFAAVFVLRPGHRRPGHHRPVHRRRGVWHIGAALNGPLWEAVAKGLRVLLATLGLFLFALVLATALFGIDSPTGNFAPAFVWVIWWVGLVYLTALIGDVWPWLSPWRLLAVTLENLLGGTVRRLAYPPAVGQWPAVLLFFLFAWIELVSEAGEDPRTLGMLILAYSLLTAVGVLLFGARSWLAHGEVFAVVFALFGRFAPLRFEGDGLRLRVFGHGLLTDAAVSTALMIFIILMLATVSFDGFLETPAWAALLDWIVADTTLRPLLLMLRAAGINLLTAIKSGALLLAPIIFLGVYLVFCWLIRLMSAAPRSTLEIARAFVFSLVPIAIAYHLAHYYSFLLIAGQSIIPLVSDPFGFGWDLFGTAGHRVDITLVNAKTTWYVAVVAIVAGHVIAVLIAHLIALRLFARPRAAVLSQVPMTVLMVGYTMVSLWILSQPIVESPAL